MVRSRRAEATHGLVPYTGIVPGEASLDHAGPLAPSVELAARTLTAIAGEDVVDGVRLDARQPRGIPGEDYATSVGEDVDDCSVGVLEEGFDWPFSDAAVDDAVRSAIGRLGDDGVETSDVSVPLHRRSLSIWPAIGTLGGVRMLAEGGVGTNRDGWAWTSLARALHARVRARSRDLPPSVKRAAFAAEYLEREYGLELYATARNLALAARREYDALLDDHDALVLPTTAILPFERAPDLERVEATEREVHTIANTSPFNLTGHPAITVPCGTVEGLPVGLMLVGARGDEGTLFRLAAAVEARTDWAVP